MTSTNPPTKHHYIPAFYLRRWKGSDGKVIEFSKPYRDIVDKPIAPERTGYQERLYELKGYEPEIAQQVEAGFFKSIDTSAANALDLLERHGHEAPWDPTSRSAWTRFILSLLLRCPEDIDIFRQWWHADFVRADEDAEAQYRAARSNKHPETFAEFLENQPLSLKERHQYEVLIRLIDHDGIGREINNMHWRVLETPPDAPLLLTSDRPVIRSHNISGRQGHIALPIGPRMLFIASPDEIFIRQMLMVRQVHLVKEVNRQVVGGAVRFVYGVDNAQLPFVKSRFGKNPQPRLMESLIQRRGASNKS